MNTVTFIDRTLKTEENGTSRESPDSPRNRVVDSHDVDVFCNTQKHLLLKPFETEFDEKWSWELRERRNKRVCWTGVTISLYKLIPKEDEKLYLRTRNTPFQCTIPPDHGCVPEPEIETYPRLLVDR